jgi:misacylated tRNA(Ala) deacylase
MTTELFRADPYRAEFVAQVVARTGAWITLDRTCFWPGDQHDHGWLGPHQVLDVRRGPDGQSVRHQVQIVDGRLPGPGDRVAGAIDWSRRHRAMRAHTAEHLVDLALRATHDVLGVAPSVGRDGEPRISVVLASGQLDSRTVSSWVADIVSDDLPMPISLEADDSRQQVWHLDGHGHRPCNCLHVLSTGEVGTVDLHKAGERGARLELQLEVGEVADYTERIL